MKQLTNDDVRVLDRAIVTFGVPNQLNMVVEECIELAEQLDILIANMRANERIVMSSWTEADEDNLIDEIADVYIVGQQILQIYGSDARELFSAAYIEVGMSYDYNSLPLKRMAQLVLSMLIRIALAALKLQRDLPNARPLWESTARGFGIVQFFLERLLDSVGDAGHENANRVIDAKIERLNKRIEKQKEVLRDSTQVAYQ